MGLFSNLFGKKEEKPLEPKKERLEDFFKIDIRDIFKYEPEYKYTDTNIVGKGVRHYSLRLKQLELGMFYEIEIIQVAENEFTLVFNGRGNCITTELADFLKYYTSENGLDESGYGYVEQSDYMNLQRHIFSRFWKNLMIDNMNGNMVMSILGINMKTGINQQP